VSDTTATRLAVEVIKGNPAERILVIAPSYRQFGYWCRENDINPRARNVVCVTNLRHIRGCANCWYVHLGVADTTEGTHLLRVLELNKSSFGFKNAEVISGSADGQDA
jgi:hypothetical protein